MQPELIARLVGLVQKTGERVVLANPETGKAVVVLDLAEYERLCEGVLTLLPNPSSKEEGPVLRGPSLARSAEEGLGRSTSSSISAFTAPVQTTQVAQKNVVEIPQKPRQPSDNPFKKRGQQLGVQDPAPTATNRDLTQEELLGKINRDIVAWKTIQERKRTDELKAVAHTTPRLETVDAMEEEERFYLEPIE